jgi:hypothetical protein
LCPLTLDYTQGIKKREERATKLKLVTWSNGGISSWREFEIFS